MRQIWASIFFSLLLPNLDEVTERKRLDGGDNTVLSSSLEEVSFLGLNRLTLKVHLYSSLLGLNLGELIGNLTRKDLLLTSGLPDVLDTNVNTLLENASVDGLVDTNSNGRLGYVEDDSSAAVVVLERHTLVNGRVAEDVDVITNLYRHEILRKIGQTMLTVFLLKHVTGTCAGSE